eukprot:2460898-Prymnesium_polylepis.1
MYTHFDTPRLHPSFRSSAVDRCTYKCRRASSHVRMRAACCTLTGSPLRWFIVRSQGSLRTKKESALRLPHVLSVVTHVPSWLGCVGRFGGRVEYTQNRLASFGCLRAHTDELDHNHVCQSAPQSARSARYRLTAHHRP